MTISTTEERFWKYVQKDGPEVRSGLGRCWVWTGAMNSNGYGEIFVARPRRKRKATHVALELTGVLVLAGRCVMHLCDNPACVNPAHLKLGTQVENIKDAVDKGHMRRGETHPCARLTDADVAFIRSSASDAETRRALAAQFGVLPLTVWKIQTGRSRSKGSTSRKLRGAA